MALRGAKEELSLDLWGATGFRWPFWGAKKEEGLQLPFWGAKDGGLPCVGHGPLRGR